MQWTQRNINFAKSFFEDKPLQFVGSVYGEIGKDILKSSLQYPKAVHRYIMRPNGLPTNQVAFLGESNVGKSSLIKALLNDNNDTYVKTSRHAGHTKSLNFFSIGSDISKPPNEKSLLLVDMPGYGKKSREEWGSLVYLYLAEREKRGSGLRRLFLLLDSTRQISEYDIGVMGLLEDWTIPYQIVLTKADNFPQEFEKFNSLIEKRLETFIKNRTTACRPNVVRTSAKSFEGIDELRCEILSASGILKVTGNYS